MTAVSFKLLALAAVCLLGCRPARAQEAPLERFDTPGGAQCVVALPARANGKLLLIAHGFIPPGRPLYVGVRPADPVCQRLLGEGWTVAATSYRRNGLVVSDGMADVEALRQAVVTRHGPMPEVIIEGVSMGGFIATAMAESPCDPSYRGVLAIGAALDLPGTPPLAVRPRIPILFLSTQDELAGPAAYAGHAREQAGATVPAVWKVARDGHVNVNRAEVDAAHRALGLLIAGVAVPSAKDATIAPPPRPLTAEFSANGRTLTGHVIDIDPAYGNLTVDFRPEDLVKLGWRKGEWAPVRIGDAPPVPTLCGTTFAEVKEGAWVCFPTADGVMLLCRNFGDAAGSAGAKIGSPVVVERPASD